MKEMHVKDTIFKREVNNGKFGNLVQGNNYTNDEITEAFKRKDGCNIACVAEVSKSPGNMHIGFHSHE